MPRHAVRSRGTYAADSPVSIKSKNPLAMSIPASRSNRSNMLAKVAISSRASVALDLSRSIAIPSPCRNSEGSLSAEDVRKPQLSPFDDPRKPDVIRVVIENRRWLLGLDRVDEGLQYLRGLGVVPHNRLGHVAWIGSRHSKGLRRETIRGT
jgi:hypothetical protein